MARRREPLAYWSGDPIMSRVIYPRLTEDDTDEQAERLYRQTLQTARAYLATENLAEKLHDRNELPGEYVVPG